MKEYWLLAGREMDGSHVKHYLLLSNRGSRKQLTANQLSTFYKSNDILNINVSGNNVSGVGISLNSLPKYKRQNGQLVQYGGINEQQVIAQADSLIKRYENKQNIEEKKKYDKLSQKTKDRIDNATKRYVDCEVDTLLAAPTAIASATTLNVVGVAKSGITGLKSQASVLVADAYAVGSVASGVNDAFKNSDNISDGIETAKQYTQYAADSAVDRVKAQPERALEALDNGVQMIEGCVQASNNEDLIGLWDSVSEILPSSKDSNNKN